MLDPTYRSQLCEKLIGWKNNNHARLPLAPEHQLSDCRHALGKNLAGLSEQAASDKNATGLLPDTVTVSHKNVSKHKGKVVGSRA